MRIELNKVGNGTLGVLLFDHATITITLLLKINSGFVAQ